MRDAGWIASFSLMPITAQISTVSDRKTAGFQALRKTLGYGWSVAVAALPSEGKPQMAR
jgi:hypothetical protein